MKRLLLGLAVLCAGCGGSSGIRHPSAAYKGAELSPPIPVKSFTLTDQSGARAGLAAKPGHYVILTFLYTHCPDVCPIIAGNLNTALRIPVAKQAGLRIVAVSVDPKRDTPAAVRSYVRAHRLLPSFRYLIGSRKQLASVWRAYHVAALAGAKGTVAHTAIEFLIDPAGREVLTYGSDVQAAWVLHDLKLLEGSS